jgi:hypothetical protein
MSKVFAAGGYLGPEANSTVGLVEDCEVEDIDWEFERFVNDRIPSPLIWIKSHSEIWSSGDSEGILTDFNPRAFMKQCTAEFEKLLADRTQVPA